MTALYFVVLVLASIGFGAFAAAEIILYRQLRSDDLIDRIGDYSMLD